MKCRVCLAWVLGLLGGLVAPSAAYARETSGTSLVRAIPAPDAPSYIPEMAQLHAIAATLESKPESTGARGSVRTRTDADPVDLDASDDVNMSELCEKQCGTVKEIRRLPRVIVDNLAALPVLGAFVVPVTDGVTIENEEGRPVVTFSVKPTKFVRGSGFVVATGRF